MACYTEVEVNLDDNEINRESRKKLGLRETGSLSENDARRVRIEAGIIKAGRLTRRMAPTAVIRREGNKLVVTVNQ